jgi:hypothetical protein
LRASASSRMAASRIALSALNAERMVESDNPRPYNSTFHASTWDGLSRLRG